MIRCDVLEAVDVLDARKKAVIRGEVRVPAQHMNARDFVLLSMALYTLQLVLCDCVVVWG